MSCLDPPLTAVPPGMWLCPKCKVSTIPGSKIAVHSCSKTPCKRTQHCRMLHVASVCPPCCMLLRVVWSFCAKFETGQTLCQQLPTSLLFRDRRSVARLCWIRLHSYAPALNMVLETASPKGCILPTVHCRSQHCCELLHPFANHCQRGRNSSQQQCCELLRPFARSLKSDAKNV